MAWWIWILFGLVLLGLEVMTTGMHLGFFGVGALAVGLLVAVGLGGPLWLQILLFSILSIVLLVLFRQPMLRKMRGEDSKIQVDTLVGETAIAAVAMSPQGFGRAELRGSSWSAKNVGEAPISAGERCKVEQVAGLMLMLRGEGK